MLSYILKLLLSAQLRGHHPLHMRDKDLVSVKHKSLYYILHENGTVRSETVKVQLSIFRLDSQICRRSAIASSLSFESCSLMLLQ